jgi:hypothetical protein
LWHHIICGASFAHAGSSRLTLNLNFDDFLSLAAVQLQGPLGPAQSSDIVTDACVVVRACILSMQYISIDLMMRMRYSIRTAFTVLSIAQSCNGFVAVRSGTAGSSANRVSCSRAQKDKNTSSYETSDASSKGIVSSLTGLVNLVMTRTASKQDGNKVQGERTR